MNKFLNAIRRWWVARKLWCCESDYTDQQWDEMRRSYLAADGDGEEWNHLIEVRTLEY